MMSTHYNQHSSPYQFAQSSPLQPGQTQQWAQSTALGSSSRQNLSNGSAGLHFMNYDNLFQSNPQNLDEHTFFNLLMKATDNDLLQARNPAFIALFTKVSTLEAQLDAQRELVSALKGMLQNQPATSIPFQASGSGKLIIPTPLPQSDQTNFEHVKFWTQNDWVNHKQNCLDRNKEYKKLGFLTNEDGQVVDKNRIKAMSEYAKQLWNSLCSENRAPESWGSRTSFVSEYFSNSMRTRFLEFRWCEGDWKVHVFATIWYPDYIAQTRKAGSNPKRKAENDTDPGSNHKGKKPKKQRTNEAPPANADVINLDDNELSGDPVPSSSAPPTIVDSGIPTSLTTSIVKLKTPPRPRPLPRPTAQASAPSESLSAPVVPPPTTIEAPAATEETTWNSPADSTGNFHAPPPQVHETPSNAPRSDSKTPPSQGGNPLPAPKDDADPRSKPLSTEKTAQTEDNLFTNLMIPAPSEEVPFTTTEPPTDAKPKKKGKPMVQPKPTSGRNIFAIEWLEAHTDTTPAKFKKIYEALDQATQDKYEALADEKKKEGAQKKATRRRDAAN